MNKSESIKNLSMALVKAQAILTNAKNTAENPFFKSKYAPLGDVLDLLRPVLAKNGLAIIQYPSSEDGKTISIHTMLTHESGEYIDFDPLTLTAEKITPQGAGAAITYGRRYSVSGIFNIASEDDDDGNALEKPQLSKYQPAKQPTNNITIEQAKALQAAAIDKYGDNHAQLFEELTSYKKYGAVPAKEYNKILAMVKSDAN